MSQIPRRGFLASLAALMAAPFLPMPAVAEPIVDVWLPLHYDEANTLAFRHPQPKVWRVYSTNDTLARR